MEGVMLVLFVIFLFFFVAKMVANEFTKMTGIKMRPLSKIGLYLLRVLRLAIREIVNLSLLLIRRRRQRHPYRQRGNPQRSPRRRHPRRRR